MSEGSTNQTEGVARVTEQPASVATARRRTPKQDPTLAQAVETARKAVVESAGEENIGEHLSIEVHEDRLLTHLFECTMAGYPGWTWFATVARAPRTKLVTVCEVGLLAGEKSLLAPDWVPWEERMQAVNDQHDAEGEEFPIESSSENTDATEDPRASVTADEDPVADAPSEHEEDDRAQHWNEESS
ncbi:DUF3027 domain-containing protein [Kocuria sp. cx-116]|uniref:DUF3027 domain-containing protein n=1 Tax=Kocuria sp. cx-116 TaxID=2771378 RepID=UPI0016871A21|nr:DUF3027 domain-containing protein [Kocuria sp. cx-116]MBD2762838.1 DUF3027 domain-containing protein [Kocuria sp. cx-116]